MFDLNSKQITLKMTYKDNKVYLYANDTLTQVLDYTPKSRALEIGIKSFNYGLEVTNYDATTDPNDERLINHTQTNADFSNSILLGTDYKTATTYTIEFDFTILNANQGFLFNYTDDNNFIMWQINTEQNKIRIRPHFRKNGQWQVPQEPDITQQLLSGLNIASVSEFIGLQVHERIEVEQVGNSSLIKTYFGLNKNEMHEVWSYTYQGLISLSKIGFRQSGAASEVSLYDNITLKVADTIHYNNDFSQTETGFINPVNGKIEVEEGQLKVGVVGGMGDQLYIQKDVSTEQVFEKIVTIDKLEQAFLNIAATGPYALYINDIKVEKSFKRISRDGYTYDAYDIKAHMHTGQNKIEVKTLTNDTTVRIQGLINQTEILSDLTWIKTAI